MDIVDKRFSTEHSPVQKSQGLGVYVIIVAAVAALAGILFGYDTGVISGAILYIKPELKLLPVATGFVVSSVLFGALLGSLLGGRLADTLGRRKLLIITALVFVFGTLGSALAAGYWTLVFCRMIVGVAIGVASFVAPLYISEIAPPRFRGMLVSLNQLAITVGIVLAYLIDAYYADAKAWRWMLGIGVVPAVILLLGMLVLPRSPRWMVLKGFNREAKHVLQRLREGRNVDKEMAAIENSIENKKTDWRVLLAPWLLPAIVIAFGLAFFQQVTGINTIIYYSPKIFQYAGFHAASAAIKVSLIIGVVNVVFTIIALPIIDLWGRRPLLLCGLVGMGVSLCVLGYAFYIGDFGGMLKWMALGSMILFIASFAMSLGPIMWLVIAEIFPLEVRGLASSVAVAASWGFNMLVAQLFPSMLSGLGTSVTFYVFTAFCVVAWLFVFFVVPETKGVSLEEIEENLRAGKSSRRLGA